MKRIKVIRSGSAANCYIIFFDGFNAIIDFGVSKKDVIKSIGSTETKKIEFGLLTHEHSDHSKFIDQWKYLDIYTSDKARKLLCRSQLKCIHSDKFEFIDQFNIEPFKLHHGNTSSLGFIITNVLTMKRLLFATDMRELPECFYSHIDYYVVEANYKESLLDNKIPIILNDHLFYKPSTLLNDQIKQSHMEIDNLINSLKQRNLKKTKKIMLIHLSEKNANDELFKYMIENQLGIECVIGSDGAVMELEG